MDEAAITRYIEENLPGVDVTVASKDNGAPEVSWGDSFFIFDPEHNLEGSRQFPFATIVTKDYADFDDASDLDRPGVFRLNIGVGKETFDAMFGGKEGFDFAALDRVMPHPVYGQYHWICVLNPSDATFESLKPLLAEAHAIAQKRTEPRR